MTYNEISAIHSYIEYYNFHNKVVPIFTCFPHLIKSRIQKSNVLSLLLLVPQLRCNINVQVTLLPSHPTRNHLNIHGIPSMDDTPQSSNFYTRSLAACKHTHCFCIYLISLTLNTNDPFTPCALNNINTQCHSYHTHTLTCKL